MIFIDGTRQEGAKAEKLIAEAKKIVKDELGLDPNNFKATFRLNKQYFRKQSDEKGRVRDAAPSAYGIELRYNTQVKGESAKEIIYCENYTPATNTKAANYLPLYRDIVDGRPLTVTEAELELFWFLYKHPARLGSEANGFKKTHIFYLYNPESEAKEKNKKRDALVESAQLIQNKSEEELRTIARAFFITEASELKLAGLQNALYEIAEKDAKTFIAKLKSKEFEARALVGELLEKGVIEFRPMIKSWFAEDEKILTVTTKDHREALINFLSNEGNEWLSRLKNSTLEPA